jgi:single-stranded-DNA-specific exonuclease
MKERHLRLELVQQSTTAEGFPAMSGVTRAVGWDMASQAQSLGLTQGKSIDVAYRIRENLHPDFGGLEIEIAGLEPATA